MRPANAAAVSLVGRRLRNGARAASSQRLLPGGCRDLQGDAAAISSLPVVETGMESGGHDGRGHVVDELRAPSLLDRLEWGDCRQPTMVCPIAIHLQPHAGGLSVDSRRRFLDA